MSELVTGFYGKLPARNDFVSFGLDPALVSAFDTWLSDRLAIARRHDPQAGSRFAPWRFAIAAGVLAPAGVIGVIGPSRDGVNRPYPLSLICPLPRSAPALAVAASHPQWFEAAAALISSTVETRLEPQTVQAAASGLPMVSPVTPSLSADGSALTLGASGGLTVSLAAMVGRLLANRPHGHSLWWTGDAAASLLCDHMPGPGQARLLWSTDGQ